MVAPIVFVDTETTGVDIETHNVWEIAIIEADGTEHVWLTNPDHVALERADPYALSLSGFYERMDFWPRRLPTLGGSRPSDYDIAMDVAKLTAGKHIVAAVPSFDAAFLRKFLLTNGLSPAWHYHLVDVEAMAAGVLGIEPPWDSRRLNADLDIDVNEADKHTALGDARWAKAMYYASLSRARSRAWPSR